MRRCTPATSPTPIFSASHCSRRLASFLRSSSISSLISASRSLACSSVSSSSWRAASSKLHEPALHFVDLGGHALQFHREPAGGFVHQVDGFIRQEAVADVAAGQFGGSDECGIFDSHAFVVRFVTRLEAAQDGDRIFDARFADEHGLEAAFECGIFFDVLAEFVERGRADAAEFAAGERGLEQIGRVVAAFGSACADDRVEFVDEQDDVAGVGDFFDERFEPLFEFAAELRAGDQCAHVERDDATVLEAFGHVALENSEREAFDDRRFADARLADEDGVVFGSPRKHLDDAANFLVAADHRIELALRGPVRPGRCRIFRGPEICPRAIGRSRGPSRAPIATRRGLCSLSIALSCSTSCAFDFVPASASSSARSRRSRPSCCRLRLVRHRALSQAAARGSAASRLLDAADALTPLDDGFELPDVRADFFEHRAHDAAVLVQERRQQVDRLNLRIPRLRGQLLRAGDGLLGFDR